jgi:hypothetical protein
MRGRALLGIVLVVVPAVADPRQFDAIRINQAITIALPDAQCDAKVVSRDPDQLTVALKKTTQACGERKSLVTVWRTDVENVIDERPPGRRLVEDGNSRAAACTIAGSVLVATSAGQYVGETTKGNAPMLLVIARGAAVSAARCYGVFFPRGPRYSVFTSRVTAPAAKATLP